MKVWNIRLNKKVAAIAVLAVAAAIVLSVFLLGESKKQENPPAAPQEPVAAETEEQRTAYLQSIGWQLAEAQPEAREITIPAEFDDVYRSYNELQKEQGFDLSTFKGKQAMRYTYMLSNYPDHPEGIQANLLVCEGKLIGGDVCSVEMNGFMHGLRLPE